MQKNILFIALLCVQMLGFAQGTGAIIAPLRADFPTFQRSALGFKSDVPPEKALDLMPLIGEPLDQGSTQTCVGHAIAHWVELLENKNVSRKTNRHFSPYFTYNLAVKNKEGNCNLGTTAGEGLDILRHIGICYLSDFPNDAGNNCATQPNVTQTKLAEVHRVESICIFDDTKKGAIQISGAEKIAELKDFLSKGQPVLLEMGLPTSFERESLKTREYWYSDMGDATPSQAYYHAMVLCGYENGDFSILNSWGKEFGKEGIIKMTEKDLVTYTKRAYVGTQNPKPAQALTLTLSLQLFDASARFTTPCEVNWNEHEKQYEPTKKEWYVNKDQYQLHITNMTQGARVLAFSYNPKGEYFQHFPFQGYNNGGTGIVSKTGSQPVNIPAAGMSTVIPKDGGALFPDAVGKDYMCILFSKQDFTISPMDIDNFSGQEGNFYEKLKAALGERLIPAEYITYDSNAMRVSVSPNAPGNIAYLILKTNCVEP